MTFPLRSNIWEGCGIGSFSNDAGSELTMLDPVVIPVFAIAAAGTNMPAASTPHKALIPRNATILPRVVAVSKKGDFLAAMRTSLQGRANVASMTKWEYATLPLVIHATKQILDQWGDDGWELVAVVPGPNGTSPVAYMKRPKA
ncbi:hypothetical protein GCM10009526_13490 [Glutamicibacter creatinolyticus]